MLQAVIFDLDETLIDWSEHNADWTELRRVHLKPVYEHLVQAGHNIPDLETLVDTYQSINHDAWMAASPPDLIAPRQIKVLKETLQALKIEPDSVELSKLQQMYEWGPLPGVTAYPDAQAVLRTIREAGLKTGLMTNASSPMWMRDRELEALGLLPFFDVRMTAGDVGHLKPHPRAFRAVLEQLRVPAAEAVFVGDRLYDDISGAQGVGMRAVWVRRQPDQEQDSIHPDAIIEHLAELPGVLDQWFPGWRKAR